MIESSIDICKKYTVSLIAHRILWEYRMLKMSGFPGELESFVEYWICTNVRGFDDVLIDKVLEEVLSRIVVDNAKHSSC